MSRELRREPSDRDHPALAQLDPSTKFLYTPHTVTCLVLGILAVIYYSRTFNPPPVHDDAQQAYDNVKHGLWAAVLVYLGYSAIQGPVTCMVRPHPAVWRLAHGIMVIYLVILVFLLFQNVNDARAMLKHLYPELGQELPERSYGSDCRLHIPGKGINWETIKATLFDEFVVAHTLGWWGKALILRNYTLCWTLSIAFEFMELTFAHMLPNFNECWWDSWVLDVLVCNALGIWAGMWTVRWFGSRTYNWSGLSQQPTILAKARRSLMQFSPYSWDDFDWRVFSSPLRLLKSLVPVGIMLIAEVNAFFLKYVLWVPPLNPLNTYRLCLLAMAALPAVKEWYMFIDHNETDIFHKLGHFAWLVTAIVAAETLVAIKFGRGMFPHPWPARVLWAWGAFGIVAGGLFLLWCVRHYSRPLQQRQLKNKAA